MNPDDDVIRAGDIIMKVRASPCCGNSVDIGVPYKVLEVSKVIAQCSLCGLIRSDLFVRVDDSSVADDENLLLLSTVKKIKGCGVTEEHETELVTYWR